MKLIMSIKLILNKRIYNKRLSDTVLLCTLLHSLFDEGEMQIFRTSAVTMFTFQLCPLTQVRKSSPMWNTEVVGLQQRSHVNFRAKLHLKSSNSVCKQTHSDSSWKQKGKHLGEHEQKPLKTDHHCHDHTGMKSLSMTTSM